MECPLVSCITPTCNRDRFLPEAIQHFLAQDYPNKELIVVDDSSNAPRRVPESDQITYVYQPLRSSLGDKRNQAISLSRGEIIMHWDDDDWMAPRRIRYQVESLLDSRADMCGLDRLLFYDTRSDRMWLYKYPPVRNKWLAGGSLCYWKSVWERKKFQSITAGEDTQFVWAPPVTTMVSLSDFTFYVALIHGGNTCAKSLSGPCWTVWNEKSFAQLKAGDAAGHGNSVGRSARPSARDVEPSGTASRTSRGAAMKLNLGCCDALLAGFINVDKVPGPGIEVADLATPWPWPENSVDHVRAWDIIEHLPDKILTMNQMWRVLVPGGTAEISVPTTDGSGAFQDPTHVSFWNRRSFLYYEAGNPYRERFARSYGIEAKFRIMTERIDPSLDGPRLTIVLQAIKP